MPLTLDEMQTRLGRLMLNVWDMEKSLVEATERAVKAEARVAELEKPREAE